MASHRATIVCMALLLLQTITGQHINVATPNILTTGNSAQFSNVASTHLPNSHFANVASANHANSGQLINTGSLPNSGGRSSILTVTSSSPISPVGLAVYADNIVLEGPLAVTGQVPYLGTIGFEGSLDTVGQGVATCGCGDGSVGIVSEGLSRRK